MLVGLSGWDFSRHSVPVEEILSGGPPRDGIPALHDPHFVTAVQADHDFMKDQDRVLGLVVRGEEKAYPIKILNWHEIVNDRIGGRPVVVTFCPLCGTGMVFDARVGGRKLSFGVSGLLYKSDLLLYDRETESLWSQIMGEAVAGALTGSRLTLIPSTHTTWKQWKKQHPRTRVLSTRTGHPRDYERDPYEGYYTSERLMFRVRPQSRRYHPKEQVVGIELAGEAKAYPFSELARSRTPLKDKVGGREIRVEFDASSRTAMVRDANGKPLPAVVGFWFAWFGFHPDTAVYTADAGQEK